MSSCLQSSNTVKLNEGDFNTTCDTVNEIVFFGSMDDSNSTENGVQQPNSTDADINLKFSSNLYEDNREFCPSEMNKNVEYDIEEDDEFKDFQNPLNDPEDDLFAERHDKTTPTSDTSDIEENIVNLEQMQLEKETTVEVDNDQEEDYSDFGDFGDFDESNLEVCEIPVSLDSHRFAFLSDPVNCRIFVLLTVLAIFPWRRQSQREIEGWFGWLDAYFEAAANPCWE